MQNGGDTYITILVELTSDDVLDAAYDWLCKRRRLSRRCRRVVVEASLGAGERQTHGGIGCGPLPRQPAHQDHARAGPFDPGVGGTKTAMDCLEILAQYSLPLLCHKRLITTSLL